MLSAAAASGRPVIALHGIEVQFATKSGPVTVVDDVDLSIGAGEVLGLVGESGCGKSMLARSILRLIPRFGRISRGRIEFDDIDLLALDDEAMRRVRGDRIAFVPQEPMTSLNPALRIVDQITEVLAAHRPALDRTARTARAVEMLERMGIQLAAHRLRQYPHELSGGMRQRVMIAMALVCGGVRLLIADEPTTALDVTIQAQILDLFVNLQAEHRMAVLLITHDLSVVAHAAHRVAVMYAGSIVELADVVTLFDAPLHPYTRGLLRSLPRPAAGARKSRLAAIAGTVPNPADLPPGCRFYARCPHHLEHPCHSVRPALEEAAPGQWVRCHRWRELPRFAVAAQ
jgi:oligopeptide/dipeptide ABC transporter ATP-binding protein